MTAFNRQLAAAAAQYDSMSPPEPDERDYEGAVKAVADELVSSDEVAELVQEIFDASPELLAALSAIRAPSFDVTTLLQRVRRIVRNVEGAIA